MDIDFKKLKEQFNKRDELFHITIPNAKNVIIHFWNNMVSKKIEWIPEYDEIAEWLTDNKGKGLFLYGANGRGKSVMIEIVLPAILLTYYRKIIYKTTAIGMNELIDKELVLTELLKKKLISIDDVGKESELVYYGAIRIAFAELMDNAEKNGVFVLASSNLDANGLLAKYDLAVVERISTCCKRVLFDKKKESLREK